jgi:hypothetical protein
MPALQPSAVNGERPLPGVLVCLLDVIGRPECTIYLG